jgi:hypothetical protein
MKSLHVRSVHDGTYVESCAGDRALVIRLGRLGCALSDLRLLSPCRPSLAFGEEICWQVITNYMSAVASLPISHVSTYLRTCVTRIELVSGLYKSALVTMFL